MGKKSSDDWQYRLPYFNETKDAIENPIPEGSTEDPLVLENRRLGMLAIKEILDETAVTFQLEEDARGLLWTQPEPAEA